MVTSSCGGQGKKMGQISKEASGEKCTHMRGLTFALIVPFLVILIAFAMVPNSSVQQQTGSKFLWNPIINLPIANSWFGKPNRSTNLLSYAVIFDAGSSGSRVHVFCFDENIRLVKVGGEIEVFEHREPGLSDFSKDPAKGAESLLPLLDTALKVVPASQKAQTPVRLGATAGFRTLPGNEAENLLQEARILLGNSGFNFTPSWVNIIDGTQEGSYQWVTINYLRGSLGQKFDRTVGIVDLGGGSVQMAYAISDEDFERAPKSENKETSDVQKIKLLGLTYNLYVHSYLRYGLLAFRAEVFKQETTGLNPCVPRGYKGTYLYAGIDFAVKATEEGSNFSQCQEVVLKSLNVGHECAHMKCSFGGIWNGGGGDGFKQLFVASFFFDKAVDAGIVRSKKLASAIVKPYQFEEAAQRFCQLSIPEIAVRYPRLKEEKAKYICLDLVYIYNLLVKGFRIDQNQKLTLVKRVHFRGSEVEAAWPLGSAIELVSGYQ